MDPEPRAVDPVAEAMRLLAVELAGEAGRLASRMRADAGARVWTKSSGTDVVSAADTAVEELLRGRLATLRPTDLVLGEEGGAAGAGDGGRADRPEQWCWVLDPIDGTVNYLAGLPWYAVSVGVNRGGVTVAGAVAEPTGGRVWSAARGGGAWLDGRRLRVSDAGRLDRALVGTGFGYRAELRARQGELVSGLLPRVGDIRRSGSAALDLCAVAAGWLDGYYEHGISPWDWTAGALVAAEAGAVVRPPGAAPMMLAAAPGIADELARLLSELGADRF